VADILLCPIKHALPVSHQKSHYLRSCRMVLAARALLFALVSLPAPSISAEREGILALTLDNTNIMGFSNFLGLESSSCPSGSTPCENG
jgi:hypothetical protein